MTQRPTIFDEIIRGKVSAGKRRRPSLDEYFMEIAKIIATRSTCIRRNVGAVLVKDSHIISTGYNGAPAGLPHCTKETCIRVALDLPPGKDPHLCRAVHAEVNCIIQVAKHGTAIDGNITMYTTTFPCIDCTKILINAGIKRVAHLGDYDVNDVRAKLIADAGLRLDDFDRLSHGGY